VSGSTIIDEVVRTSAVSWLARGALGAAALAILISPMGVGFFSSRLNFTFGALGLDPSARGAAALRAMLWIAGGIAFDAVVRRGLLEWLRPRLGTIGAACVLLLVLNVAFAPVLFWYGVQTDVLSFPEVLLYENLLQLTFTIAYLTSGSFVFSGLLQGLFAAFRFTVINDVSGPFETLYFYSYSDRAFGMVLTLSPILASLWLWITARALAWTREPDRVPG
jgi:hypothetical protein